MTNQRGGRKPGPNYRLGKWHLSRDGKRTLCDSGGVYILTTTKRDQVSCQHCLKRMNDKAKWGIYGS